MHNKNKVIFDKKLPCEYNICIYVLEELCDEGVIDVFEIYEAIIPSLQATIREYISGQYAHLINIAFS